jgi:type II pantothenate kinase
VSEEVCQAAADVDFLIIEGMGRAIHTNFRVPFSVDTLKIGAFKNPFMAKALGANMYDGLVLFEASLGRK